MPDHIHFLCEGLSDNSDLVQFVDALKQRTASTAYEFKKTHGQRLWQMRYYDHILRPKEVIEDANHRVDEAELFPDKLDAALEAKHDSLEAGL
jgi:hypothetical protein